MTILARPSEWARSGSSPGPATPFAGGSQHYFAFFSYSHRDEAMAQWLHDQLEQFRVPMHLVGRITEHGAVPRRLKPIFRDLKELPASDDLGNEIRSALAASRFLIVLCSPAAANSRWTNAEIEAFKRVRPDGCVFAAIVAGEPFASEIPGREPEECLPHALRIKYDRRGRPTGKRAEPLAADLRGGPEARRLGFLKLIAGMLGIGLDDLVQRESVQRHRRMAMISGGSLVGMLVAIGLAVTAIQARDAARDQRREAESLIGFMLGDLKQKLEPVGRLEVLDGVGARVLDYYKKQDTAALSDASLAQRSKALTLMGEIANARGDLSTALRFYREAFAGTQEALRRTPDDPQRLFDHAQNVYWLGYIDFQRGNLDSAEQAFREYDRLAHSMVAAEPTNTKWLLERTYATNNLGVVLLERARYRDASAIFGEALRVSEGLVAVNPDDRVFQDRLIEGLAWLADARESAGFLGEATALRERQLDYMQKLTGSRRDDATLKRKTMTAHRVMGRLLASRGETARGLASLETAAAFAREMLRTDPDNTEWAQFAAHILFDQGELQLSSGRSEQAGQSVSEGCAVASRLAARDRTVVEWRAVLPARCLTLRAQLALAQGRPGEAEELAGRLAQLSRGEAGRNPSADTRIGLAQAELLRGDIARRLGDSQAALAAWRAADSAWPQVTELTPRETAVRRILLQRLGRQGESRRLAERLAAIGFRHPAYMPARTGAGGGEQG